MPFIETKNIGAWANLLASKDGFQYITWASILMKVY